MANSNNFIVLGENVKAVGIISRITAISRKTARNFHEMWLNCPSASTQPLSAMRCTLKMFSISAKE